MNKLLAYIMITRPLNVAMGGLTILISSFIVNAFSYALSKISIPLRGKHEDICQTQ